MKLQIIKDDRFSSGKWRVVDETGEAIAIPMAFNHPDCGPSIINAPLCDSSKEKIIERVLDLVVRQAADIERLKRLLHKYKTRGC